MTHFIEKHYNLDDHGNMVPNDALIAGIRPCKFNYEDVLKFMNGKLKTTLTLEASIATFSFNYDYATQKEFQNIEEWLIWLDLEKGISIDFEDTLLTDGLSSYVAKTVDLHTNEVVYDYVDKTIKQLLDNRHKA